MASKLPKPSDLEIDYYATLNVEPTATKKEITAAYRVLARKYHPDKNPGDLSAAELFQQVQKAYEILTDDKARAAFDGVIKARLARKAREAAESASRKRMREELRAREDERAKRQKVSEEEERAKRLFEAELERLKEEAMREDRKRRQQQADEEISRREHTTGGGGITSTGLRVPSMAEFERFENDILERMVRMGQAQKQRLQQQQTL